MDIHSAFRMGSQELARHDKEYSMLHKGHGIEEANWLLLTQPEYWSNEQAKQIRSILANVLEVSMTIAGLPAIPMPGHYVAALISEVVSPCNRMLACVKAPDTFNAVDASGLLGTHEIKPMTTQQMMALVIAYSGNATLEPVVQKLPREVEETMKKEAKK